jgi:hypothetical protein
VTGTSNKIVRRGRFTELIKGTGNEHGRNRLRTENKMELRLLVSGIDLIMQPSHRSIDRLT